MQPSWFNNISKKVVCKSRPGNLFCSAWNFWIVHECIYYVQAKYGFQLLSVDGQFSKTQPHILCISKLCTYQSYKLHLLTKGSDKRGCTVAGKLCGRINQFLSSIK